MMFRFWWKRQWTPFHAQDNHRGGGGSPIHHKFLQEMFPSHDDSNELQHQDFGRSN